jgi:hypothetical protein
VAGIAAMRLAAPTITNAPEPPGARLEWEDGEEQGLTRCEDHQ